VRRQRNSLDDLTTAEMRRRAAVVRARIQAEEADARDLDLVGFCVCLGLLLAWAAFS
jgi:hypothetical protein